MFTIKRSFITTLIERFKETAPLIQILMGPRQVGKTTGVLQFVEMINDPYHYASADDKISSDSNWIREQWQIASFKSNNTILIIDEIQKIPNWSEIIKKLWDEQKRKKEKIKLLLLGSSSLALTKGITESLAGRFEIIPVFHWDYTESNNLHKMDIDTFLNFGGYPKSYDYISDYDRWYQYLKNSVIDRVIDKDILQFATIKKPALFRQAFEIICSYPSQEISYRKLLGQLQDNGNTDLIKYYLSLFEGAFLIKTLQKFGNQDFKIKSSSPKIIPLCPSFYSIFSTSNEKINFVFEATVGAKLMQVSPDIYYWRQGGDEVDFVLKWRKNVYAIEVKSGNKKRPKGLESFLKLYRNAKPVIISRENYVQFIADPKTFLMKL